MRVQASMWVPSVRMACLWFTEWRGRIKQFWSQHVVVGSHLEKCISVCEVIVSPPRASTVGLQCKGPQVAPIGGYCVVLGDPVRTAIVDP